ncbi:MAG: DUF362 domain-containing protein [Acidobacteriota bacterium]
MSDTKHDCGITRREFVATGAAAGTLLATGVGFGEKSELSPDLVAAHGPDVGKNTLAALEGHGGMGAFVRPGQIVNILPNAQGSHPGTSTDPVLIKTVVDQCLGAGAKEVRWLTWQSGKYFERSNIARLVEGSGAKFIQVDSNDESLWDTFEVPNGVALEKIRVFKVLDECDVFINMPIIKDHIGSRFTGSLKNYMGASHPTDNRLFHPTFEGEDLTRMEQCIADLNTAVRKPDLIIADAMTILTSKGPFGPGDIASPNQVIAGFDRVALDAYGATLLGLEGSEVSMIVNAHELGLGEIDLGKVRIREIEVA